jgi:hypothetical protein
LPDRRHSGETSYAPRRQRQAAGRPRVDGEEVLSVGGRTCGVETELHETTVLLSARGRLIREADQAGISHAQVWEQGDLPQKRL